MRLFFNWGRLCVLFLALALLLPITYASAQMMIFPAKGQSPEQQQKDEYDCHQWAVQQSNYDPTQPQQNTAQSSGQKDRRVAKGALGGAVVGGIVGSTQGNWGKGAAIGGGVGAAGGAISRRRQAKKTQDQAQQAQGAQLQNYNRAKAACLKGKGYTVE